MTEARGEIVWTPPADVRATSRIGAFLDWLADTRDLHFDGYPDLWQWSVDDLDGFWRACAEWSGIRWHDQPTSGLARRAMPGAEWFPGGTLNYAEHALAAVGDHDSDRAADRADEVAIVAHSQTRAPAEITWAHLADGVARCRAGLVRLGVQRGDRVAAYLPNIPETIVAFLATASLGAVWSSCAPEFGTRSVVDRFAQIEPTVLLAVDGYRYGEKVVDKRADVEAIEAALPTLRHTVHVPYLGAMRRTRRLERAARASPVPLEFEPVPFDHPLYVLYSSGTTGLPKAIVHGHGGITVEHLQDHRAAPRPRRRRPLLLVHHDRLDDVELPRLRAARRRDHRAVRRRSRRSPTSARCGSSRPTPASTCSGSARRSSCRAARPGVVPPPHRLRSIGSTGAPLPPDGFRWVRDVVGAHVQTASVSGGTDVCTAFVGAVPLLPVRAGEITLPTARRARWRRSTRRAVVPARGAGRAGRHRADAVDAGRLLG